jgi:hypothetical protein
MTEGQLTPLSQPATSKRDINLGIADEAAFLDGSVGYDGTCTDMHVPFL